MFVDSYKKNAKFILSTIATVVAIYVLGQVVSAVLYISLKGGNIDETLEAWQILVVYIGLASVVLSSVYYILHSTKKGYKSVLSRLGFRQITWPTVGWSLLGIGVYFVVFLLVMSVIIALGIIDLSQTQEIGFNRDERGSSLIFAFIALVVIAPISEEILFRGFLHRRLKALTNFWFAALVSSSLFALAHWQLNVAIDTFVLSMVIVYVLEIHDNLAVAVAIHALKNLIAFMLTFFVVF